MADITKCNGNNCSLKTECYRFTAQEDSYRQSWFLDSPIELDGSCKEFWQSINSKSKRKDN